MPALISTLENFLSCNLSSSYEHLSHLLKLIGEQDSGELFLVRLSYVAMANRYSKKSNFDSFSVFSFNFEDFFKISANS